MRSTSETPTLYVTSFEANKTENITLFVLHRCNPESNSVADSNTRNYSRSHTSNTNGNASTITNVILVTIMRVMVVILIVVEIEMKKYEALSLQCCAYQSYSYCRLGAGKCPEWLYHL